MIIATIIVACVFLVLSVSYPHWSLFFILFVLPFSFALNPIKGYDLQLLRVLAPVFILGTFLKHGRSFLAEIKKYEFILLAFFILLAGISLFFAQELFWGVRKMIYLSSLAFLVPAASVILKKNENALRKAMSWFLGGAGIIAVLGIVQFGSQFFTSLNNIFALYQKISIFVWGNDFGSMIVSYPSWFVNVGGRDYLRAFAFFPDPHIMAFFMTAASAVSLSGVINERAESKKRCLAAVFLLSSLCLILTFSRGGYFGYIFALAAVGWWNRNNIRKSKKIAATAMTSGIIVAVMILGVPVGERFASSFRLTEGSNAGRLEIWSEAIRISATNGFGVGLGNFPLLFGERDYRSPVTAHNLYLDLLVETGVVGLLVWLGYYLFLIRKLVFKENENSIYLYGMAGTMVGWGVHLLFENALYSPAIFILLMFFTAASSSTYKAK